MLAPVMRVMLRRLLPSTSAARICARFAVLSRFILNIMLEKNVVVKCLLLQARPLIVYACSCKEGCRHGRFRRCGDGRES